MTNNILSPIRPQYKVLGPPPKQINIHEGLAEQESGDNRTQGRVRIYATIDPITLESEFLPESKIEAGGTVDMTFQHESCKFQVRINNVTEAVHRGLIKGPVEVGDFGSSLDSVTFHFLKFPSIGESKSFAEATFPRLDLHSANWRITIDSHGKDGFAATGRGTKKDGSHFSTTDAKALVSCLGCYLSFAFGEWSPPLFLVGLACDKIVWKYAECLAVGEGCFDKGWIDTQHPHTNLQLSTSALECGFEGFEALYSDVKWQSPLNLAVSFLIQAADSKTDREVATVVSQIPLEMISDLLELKCNAVCKMTQLLAEMSLSDCVPDSLVSLKNVSLAMDADRNCQEEGGCKGSSSTAYLPVTRGVGPSASVAIRNCLVHPTVNNREKLARFVTSSCDSLCILLDDTTRLLGKYATLAILNQMKYKCQYFDRIEGRYVPIPKDG